MARSSESRERTKIGEEFEENNEVEIHETDKVTVSDDDQNSMEEEGHIDNLGFEINANEQVAEPLDNGNAHDIEPQSPPHHPVENNLGSPRSSISNLTINVSSASDLLVAVSVGATDNRTRITDIAISGLVELIRKANDGFPLWRLDVSTGLQVINEAEYLRVYRDVSAPLSDIIRIIGSENLDGNARMTNTASQRHNMPNHLQTESSREVGFVALNPIGVVELLMDLEKWSTTFANLVSSAMILGVLSTGLTNDYDGKMQVMRAVFHFPTPLVNVRECQFVRYCKKIDNITWGIVDVSLEDFFTCSLVKFKRRPSGCLIQQIPSGHTKVTWVEHVEVNNSNDHAIFLPLIQSGLAFGASRWIATINHYSALTQITSTESMEPFVRLNNDFMMLSEGRVSIMRLGDKMMRNFCQEISGSNSMNTNSWIAYPINGANEDCRFKFNSNELITGESHNTLAFTTSIRLPVSPRRLFDYLRAVEHRSQWDLLLLDKVCHEMTHLVRGDNPHNRTSIMRVHSAQNNLEVMYLEESCVDQIALYIAHGPIDIVSMAMVCNGGNPDTVNMLPSGFVIHGERLGGSRDSIGSSTHVKVDERSILTIYFHVTGGVANCSNGSEAIDASYRILMYTASRIASAVSDRDV